jgi:hypothetical protein
MSITKTRPVKPLKILTIDGGGLQAISTLLILDKLLDAIAKNNKVAKQKPRPCDVFDTIAGIGAGGWIAILLGRFHMDITSCLSEWYKITSCIAPRSKSEEVRMRVLQNAYFDHNSLMHQIECLTALYGTGKHFIPDSCNSSDVRTKHVFVAALRTDASGYNLFRSYEIPSWAELPKKLLEGPRDPKEFTIAQAFAVTGAAKYFSPAWKETMEVSGKKRFSDTKFPKPHNITDLALNEMWGLYGTSVELSVVINIGPGLTDPYDVKHIARRFSWGLTAPLENEIPTEPPKRNSRGSVEDLSLSKTISNWMRRHSREDPDSKPARRVKFNPSSNEHAHEHEQHSHPRRSKAPIPRYDTFGSIRDQKLSTKLHKKELEIEDHILGKLDRVYGPGSGRRLYYRLALDQAPQGTALNDSEASGSCLNAARQYLKSDVAGSKVGAIVATMEDEVPLQSNKGEKEVVGRNAAKVLNDSKAVYVCWSGAPGYTSIISKTHD